MHSAAAPLRDSPKLVLVALACSHPLSHETVHGRITKIDGVKRTTETSLPCVRTHSDVRGFVWQVVTGYWHTCRCCDEVAAIFRKLTRAKHDCNKFARFPDFTENPPLCVLPQPASREVVSPIARGDSAAGQLRRHFTSQ
jgi:hypothetical protein